MRDIARRAGTNVASANYHFGSKEELYLAILRGQFAETRARLEERGATSRPERLRRMTRAQAVRLLVIRVQTILDILLGPPPSVHGTLMLREMCDPSDALPLAVEEFVKPQLDETRRILAHLCPELDAAEIERAGFSIMGQAIFYRTMRPALLLLFGRDEYPRGFTQALAEHITEFSLGGMERLRERRRKPKRGARVA
jgi:AcrR family transcriptional regulator